jgi:hypothetical protein
VLPSIPDNIPNIPTSLFAGHLHGVRDIGTVACKPGVGILEATLQAAMTNQQRLDLAKDQLNRTLGFFPRLDAKHSVVLAVDTGMLAFLFTRMPDWHVITGWFAVAPVIAVVLLALSIWCLYRGSEPALTGGHESVLYFREIAKRTESQYIDAVREISEEGYLKDLLAQVWRNSEILTAKFTHLKNALNLLALAILPWLIALAAFTLQAHPTP